MSVEFITKNCDCLVFSDLPGKQSYIQRGRHQGLTSFPINGHAHVYNSFFQFKFELEIFLFHFYELGGLIIVVKLKRLLRNAAVAM